MKDKIKGICISQAKVFLLEVGEFFPFAYGLTSENKVVPVMIYFGENQPSSIAVIRNLEIAFKTNNETENYISVAICSDVLSVPPFANEKIDSIEIRIDFIDDNSVNFYIPYKKNDSNQFIFFEEYKTEGTFNFYDSIQM